MVFDVNCILKFKTIFFCCCFSLSICGQNWFKFSIWMVLGENPIRHEKIQFGREIMNFCDFAYGLNYCWAVCVENWLELDCAVLWFKILCFKIIAIDWWRTFMMTLGKVKVKGLRTKFILRATKGGKEKKRREKKIKSEKKEKKKSNQKAFRYKMWSCFWKWANLRFLSRNKLLESKLNENSFTSSNSSTSHNGLSRPHFSATKVDTFPAQKPIDLFPKKNKSFPSRITIKV